jgi:hypothetical protein
MDQFRKDTTFHAGSLLRTLEASLDTSIQGVSAIRVERVTAGINALMHATSSSSAATLSGELQPIHGFLSDNNVALSALVIDHGSMGRGRSSQSSEDRSTHDSRTIHRNASIETMGVNGELERQGLIDIHA